MDFLSQWVLNYRRVRVEKYPPIFSRESLSSSQKWQAGLVDKPRVGKTWHLWLNCYVRTFSSAFSAGDRYQRWHAISFICFFTRKNGVAHSFIKDLWSKKNNQLYLCSKKSVVVTHTRGKKWQTSAIPSLYICTFLSYFRAHHVLLHLNSWTW